MKEKHVETLKITIIIYVQPNSVNWSIKLDELAVYKIIHFNDHYPFANEVLWIAHRRRGGLLDFTFYRYIFFPSSSNFMDQLNFPINRICKLSHITCNTDNVDIGFICINFAKYRDGPSDNLFRLGIL
jgi:hypothetical protein